MQNLTMTLSQRIYGRSKSVKIPDYSGVIWGTGAYYIVANEVLKNES